MRQALYISVPCVKDLVVCHFVRYWDHLSLYGHMGHKQTQSQSRNKVRDSEKDFGSRLAADFFCFILRARRLSSKLLKQGYLAERLKSSFRKFYGRYGDLIQQYEVSLSRMFNAILILDQQWLPNQSDFPPISWPWYRAWPSPIMSGFHWAFATGVACQQGTLTLPDTWFRSPLWDLLMLQLLRPNSSNLPCLYSTFHLEYPLVLSRFCFVV